MEVRYSVCPHSCPDSCGWQVSLENGRIHQAFLADQARQSGCRIFAFDVHKNRTAKWADEFFHILPGSHGALALGIAHIIIRDNLTDLRWARAYTSGLDDYIAALADYPPERVSRLTGLAPERLEFLARIYGGTKPGLIRIGNGFQHHDNGGMNTWAVSCLPALTGNWAYPGGGAIKFNSGYFPLNREALERPDLTMGTPRSINMNRFGQALTNGNPPVYSLYVYNSNPTVVAPAQALVKKGLGRPDLFTVVHEQVMTNTVLYADVLLPATTHLGHPDLYKSFWHCILQWADPLIPPIGEAKSNLEVFRELALRFGFKENCFRDSASDIARQALDLPYWREREISLEKLRRERFMTVPVVDTPFAAGGFPTSSGRAELKSKRAVTFGLPSVPAHRSLHEGPETSKGRYPLTLISPPNHEFINSTFNNISSLRTRSVEPLIEINPHDANSNGIQDGDLVEVFNDRGSCYLKACLSDSVLPGVTVAAGLWSHQDYVNKKGINELTPDRLSDLGDCALSFPISLEYALPKELGRCNKY